MLNALRLLWREQRVLCVAFALALGLTLFFAVRMAVFALYWADPAHRNQPIEGWMTPRYLVHSYDLPPELVREVLDLEGEPRKRRTLAGIARESGLTLEEIERRIRRAAAAHYGGAP